MKNLSLKFRLGTSTPFSYSISMFHFHVLLPVLLSCFNQMFHFYVQSKFTFFLLLLYFISMCILTFIFHVPFLCSILMFHSYVPFLCSILMFNSYVPISMFHFHLLFPTLTTRKKVVTV